MNHILDINRLQLRLLKAAGVDPSRCASVSLIISSDGVELHVVLVPTPEQVEQIAQVIESAPAGEVRVVKYEDNP